MSLKDFKSNFKNHWLQFINEGKECVNELKNPKTRYKQIPNLFTASRLFAPFFIIPTALTGNLILTSIFVAGFALTDAVDGFLARKFNASSEFGRKLDALTDKIFAGSLLFPLLFTNPSLITLLVMEGAISLVNVKAQLKNNAPKTEYIGKIKSAFLSIAILANYVSMITHIPAAIINLLTATTAILQTSSLIKYQIVDKEKQEVKRLEERYYETVLGEEDDKLNKSKELELTYEESRINDQIKPKTVLTVEERIKQLQELKAQMEFQEPEEKANQKTMNNRK